MKGPRRAPASCRCRARHPGPRRRRGPRSRPAGHGPARDGSPRRRWIPSRRPRRRRRRWGCRVRARARAGGRSPMGSRSSGLERDRARLLPRLPHPRVEEGPLLRHRGPAQPAARRRRGRDQHPDRLRPQRLLRAAAPDQQQAPVLLEPQGDLLSAGDRHRPRPLRHRLRPRLRHQQGSERALLGSGAGPAGDGARRA